MEKSFFDMDMEWDFDYLNEEDIDSDQISSKLGNKLSNYLLKKY